MPRPWMVIYLIGAAALVVWLLVGPADAHELDHDGYLFPPAVEQWRSLVAAHFKPEDVHMALHILDCESNGNRFVHNSRSGTTGLFQHRPKFWHDRAQLAGIHPADMHNAHHNIQVAAWLIYENGGIKHWEGCGPWAVAHV